TCRLIFICLREHLQNTALEADILGRYGTYHPEVIALDEVTEGQACTVLKARDWIDANRPLLIFNADTHCRTTLKDSLTKWGHKVAGALDVFRAQGSHWSFAQADESGRVMRTAEKQRISEWATTGLYYFSRGSDFVLHAEAMIRANERSNNEFY